ncbi:MAG: cytochrome c3 family protein [Thermodesulfovibrionales bacterium]|nr:cytochrome c3 family protein [Thermodesulfovibrionales bacterium]
MHVLRPLFVFLAFVSLILIVRAFYVPGDFGIHERGYMYGWYRKSNEEEWKAIKIKYQGNEYCSGCHPDQYNSLNSSHHAILQCENCHGPAIDHPTDPLKLSIDRSRELCLRCHTYLSYPTSNRANIRGIDPEKHNPGIECSMCHNPHKPTPGGKHDKKRIS